MNKKIVALFTGILFIPATAYASDVNIFVHNNPINTGGFISDDTAS